VDGSGVLADGCGVQGVPGAVLRLDPGVEHQVDVAVGVTFPGRQVAHPCRLHLQAGNLTLAAPGADAGDGHVAEVAGDLVRLAGEDTINGVGHHRVLGGHDRQRLGVVHHHLDEAQGLAIGALGADTAFDLPRRWLYPLHPCDELARLGQGGGGCTLACPPGVDLHRDAGLLGVVGLGSPVSLVEVAGGAGAGSPVEVHAALHVGCPALSKGAWDDLRGVWGEAMEPVYPGSIRAEKHLAVRLAGAEARYRRHP
jgi:hypothetical protein